MKKILSTLAVIFIISSTYAQTPKNFSYQAVFRDASNNLVTNQQISMQISILQTSTDGTAIYVETQNPETNLNGLISIEIGTGESNDDFSIIDWSNGPYFIKTETDIEGGTNYTITGTSQLLSVPYALYAKTAETVENINITGNETAFDSWDKNNTDDFSGDYNDLTNQPNLFDGNYSSLNGTPQNVSELTNDAGYLTEYTETDPDFNSWNKDYSDLINTPTNLSDFTNDVGYITDYTETDPIFNNWDKDYADLINTPENISTFTNDAGYLTSYTEIDGDNTNEIQNLNEVLTEGNTGGNSQIKEIANPTDAQDAVTKAYVDALFDILVETGAITLVDFSSDTQFNKIDSLINFSGISDINPTNWLWDFGDGNTSTLQNPTHSYSTSGTYTVSLTVSNEVLNYTEEKINYITILENGVLGDGLIDIDGNYYPTVIIGSQEWMAENLKVTRYPNGDPIPYITETDSWNALGSNDTDDAFCYYYNNPDSEYGGLYTYAASIGDNWTRDNVDDQGVCPDGWHIPTDLEWQELEISLGMDPVEANNMDWRGGNELVASKLKSETGWAGNDNSTNESGFSALPGCARGNNGGSFITNDCGYYWTSTTNNSFAYLRMFGPGINSVDRQNYSKANGFSVRCVKN